MRSDHLVLVLMRRFLGVVFIAYGLVKLFGGQFVYDEWTITRSTASGPFLVWAFYGYSPWYAKFIAMCELVPGVMLLIPRTAFVGAVALFPVALNITVMDFAYGFPGVKYLVAIYTAMLGVLILAEREKVFMLFRSHEQVRAALAATGAVTMQAPPKRSAAVRWGVNVVSTCFIVWVANMVVETSTDGPEGVARAAASEGGESLVLKRSRMWGQSGFGRRGMVQLRTATDSATVATVYLTRWSGFVPWRVDSVRRDTGGSPAPTPPPVE
jgi:uncharacterized membrane protein YphA (DoxX/SURF4 family)